MIASSDGRAVLRQRIEMIEGVGPRARQPYHAAEGMELREAEDFLRRTKEAAVEMAVKTVKQALASLAGQGYRVTRAAVLQAAGRKLPGLEAILAAHPLIHTAEGVFFRDVLKRACEACGIEVVGIRESEVLERCAAALKVSADELPTRLSEMVKAMGRPWTQDEKLATAAGLTIL